MVCKANVIKALEKGLKIFDATQKTIDEAEINESACVMLTSGQAKAALTYLKDVRLGEWCTDDFEITFCSICTAIVEKRSKYCPSCGTYMVNGRKDAYVRKD